VIISQEICRLFLSRYFAMGWARRFDILSPAAIVHEKEAVMAEKPELISFKL